MSTAERVLPQLSENQTKLCMKVLLKIYNVPLLESLHSLPPNDKIIQIDLNTIKSKLENRHYSRIEEFKDDINLVVKTAQKLVDQNIIYPQVADELKIYSRRLLDSIAKNENEQIMCTLRYQHKKLLQLLENRPKPVKHPKIVLKPPS